jgi:hypothetical protein
MPSVGLLSWGSSKIAPPPALHQVSCPGRASSSFGPRLPHLRHLPPLSFLATSAVYSTRHLAGLLHPAAGHGVRHVSGPWAWGPKTPGPLAFPDGVTPSEAFPSSAAGASSPRITGFTAVPFPLVVGWSLAVRCSPCCHGPRGGRLSFLDLRALIHSGVRCGPADVAACSPPDAPLGF